MAPPLFTATGAQLQTLLSIGKTVATTDSDPIGFEVGPKAMSITAMDTARTLLVSATLAIENGPAEPRKVGLPVKKLGDAAKVFSAKDVVEVRLANSRLTLKSGAKRKVVACDDMRNQAASPQVPNIPFTSMFELPRTFLANCVRDCDDFSMDTVRFIHDGATRFSWLEADDDGDSYDNHATVSQAPSAESFFSRGTIKRAIGLATSESIALSMADGMPLRMDFAVNGGSAVVLVAPRVYDEGMKPTAPPHDDD